MLFDNRILRRAAVDATNNVCPKCNQHFRIDTMARLAMLFDEGRFEQSDVGMVSSDPLKFVDNKLYLERLADLRASTNLDDALVSATGTLAGRVRVAIDDVLVAETEARIERAWRTVREGRGRAIAEMEFKGQPPHFGESSSGRSSVVR